MRRFLNRNVLFVDLCHAASRQVCSLFNRQKPSRQRRRKGRGRTASRLPLSVEQCERRLALDATAGDGGFLDVVPGWGSDSAGVVVETVDGGALSIMPSRGVVVDNIVGLSSPQTSLPVGLSLFGLENSGQITLEDSGQVSATATSASVTTASVTIPGVTVSPAGSVTNSASAVESTLDYSSWWNAAPILGGPFVSGNDFVIAPGNEGLAITADDLSLQSVNTRIDINDNADFLFNTSVNPVETKGGIASPITNNLPRYTQTVDTAPPVQADAFSERVDIATDMPSMSGITGNSEDAAFIVASVGAQRGPTGNNSSIGSESATHSSGQLASTSSTPQGPPKQDSNEDQQAAETEPKKADSFAEESGNQNQRRNERSRGPSLATFENDSPDVLALQTSEPQAAVLEAGDFVIVAAAASSTTVGGNQGGLLDLNAVVAQTQQAETARFVAVAFHGSSDSRSFPHWHQPSMHQPSPEVARASVFEVAAVGERTVVAPPTSKADAQQASPDTDQLSAIETSLRSMLPPETWHHDQISHAMEAALTAVFAAGVFWADEALRSQALSTHNQRVQLASQKRRPW
jgi:hypothetical protein